MVLVCVGACAPVNQVEPTPEPRIMCMNMGAVPGNQWWVYVCTFTGDTLPPILNTEPRGPTTA